MKKALLALVAAVLLAPAAASAQFVNIRLPVPLPPVPPLVVVTPGIQVVENHDEEIFFHDNHYWVRREGRWYRSRHADREFVYVEHRHVPGGLHRLPVGHYRHYRHDRHHDRRDWREDRRERREMQREREREREYRERERERERRERERERERREREEEERRRERERRRHDRNDRHGGTPSYHSGGSHQAVPAPEKRHR